MTKKLIYFNSSGLGEPLRYILHYGGQKFEDIRVDQKSWQNMKDSIPYGQIPVYEEGDRQLNQSIAIARYLASQNGLLPSDPWEQAVLEAAVLNINDLRLKISSYYYEKDEAKKEQIKKEFLTESVVYYLTRMEKELKANNGYFGGKLSWADFYLVGIIELINIVMKIEVEKDYPAINNLVKTIRSLPGVKEYIATRKPYV